MQWTFAPYIPVADIADKPVDYVWNDGNVLFYYREDPRFENRLAKICARGVVALSAAIAEWIGGRWPSLAQPVLFWELEAVWAGIVDWRYLRPPATSPHAPQGESCKGPDGGPICDAFFTLANIAARAERSSSLVSHCSALSQLAIHVLPNPEEFKAWRRRAMAQLTDLYPRQKDAPLGPPIARQTLDPQYSYTPESVDHALREFVRGLYPTENPFLRSPEELKALGFHGTPYDNR